MLWPSRNDLTDFAEIILAFTVVMLIVGWAVDAFAQPLSLIPAGMSQDAVNQMLIERVSSLTQRMDRIDNMLQYGMLGILGNLLAHLFQLMKGRK